MSEGKCPGEEMSDRRCELGIRGPRPVNFNQCYTTDSWWRGTVVERRSLTGELSLFCARLAADG